MGSSASDPDTSKPALAVRPYQPFPSYDLWNVRLDEEWERIVGELHRLRMARQETVLRSFKILRRLAAVDTGSIEDLYPADRGLTFSVAYEAALWQADFQKHTEEARSLIEAQLASYELIVDMATQRVPVNETLIRRLHEEICGPQQSYRVASRAEDGRLAWEERALEKGAYKKLPNDVLTPDNVVFRFCPPEDVVPEMERFVQQLRTPEFENSSSLFQSTYSHYALTVIHPFQDGNGRVARLLASIYLCREVSVPLLVLSEQRKEYLSALATADEGHYQPLMDFFFGCCKNALVLLRQAIDAAEQPNIEESMLRIAAAFRNESGFSHADFDRAAESLIQLLASQLTKRAESLASNLMRFAISTQDGVAFGPPDETLYRGPKKIATVNFLVTSPEPAVAKVHGALSAFVPSAARRAPIQVWWITGSPPRKPALIFEVDIADVLPTPAPSLPLRLGVMAEHVFAIVVRDLSDMVAKMMRLE